MAKKRKRSKVHRAASNVILFCLIAIFLFSAYKVGTILYNYYTDQSAYKKITKAAGAEEFTGDIDFDALREVNPEVIGWIYLKDSKINYPIVQGKDNDKYLYTLYDGSIGGAGAIFADSATNNPFEQFNTIVYGHHMKDGSMFNGLKKYRNSEYAAEHPRFELITPDKKYHLDVVAFANPRSDSDFYTNNISSDSGKSSYLNMIRKRAVYTTGVDFGPDDKIVLLSTCAYEYKAARYIVIGKLIPWE